jgi:formamidopyrimidine-DNA glycosylase
MPELPEVETIARGLAPLLVGRAIRSAAVFWQRTVAFPAVDEFVARLTGRRVVSVGRRGKYLVLELDEGYLLIHLKMSGRLRLVAEAEPPGPHTRLALDLDDGQQLRFDDARKFGRAYLLDDPLQITAALGPEPLAVDFLAADFCRLLARRKGRLKPLLLNQAFLAGLGNIYADESLFAARLHPLRRADSLDSDEEVRLYDAIRLVLGRAVNGHGTTLDDRGYVDALGKAGAYQEEIAVYGRKGRPCVRCGTPLERIVIGGRSAHFCPQCQARGVS